MNNNLIQINFKSILSSTLKIMAICLIIFYCIIYIFQNNLLFIKQQISPAAINYIHKNYPRIEDININTSDNVKLSGWFLKPSSPTKAPLIIYFGGNAEEVSNNIEDLDKFNGWSVALMNYRGYGLSGGTPSEKDLFNDALLIYDYFSKREEIDSKRVIIIGRSLGTGVATYLAQNRPVKGLVLITPYSITNVAQKKLPFVPVSVLLKSKFDSISRAAKVNIPTLMLIAQNDEVIPPSHALNLANKWLGDKTIVTISGVGHNDIQYGKGYWESILRFLARY